MSVGSVFEFEFELDGGVGGGVGGVGVGTSASFGSYFRTEADVLLVLNVLGEM